MKLFSDVIHIILNISWAANIAGMVVAVSLAAFVWVPLFGKTWLKLAGLKEENMSSNKAKNALFWSLPITFFLAANISAFCKHFQYTTPSQGFLIGYNFGLVISLFLAINYLYEQRPLKLYAISAGYALTSMSAMGLVIGWIL